MLKLALFAVASLIAVPAAAYTLPANNSSAQSAFTGKYEASNLVSGGGSLLLPGSVVVNGSFETGDFTGWTQVNDTSFSGVSGEFSGVFPTDGAFQAFFGPVDPGGGGIIQSIATSPGGVYTLTFDLANLFGGPNAFGLFWDGAFVSIDFDVPGFPYTTLTTNLIASGASTDLGFIFYHEPSYWLLDNISLTTDIPEPESWAMMIAGFGLMGAMMRRRRSNIVAA